MGVGKVPDDVEGGRKRSSKVTMTTLRAAPTRHRHTENFSGKRRRYLTKTGPRAGGGMGAKTTNYCKRKKCERND